MTFKEFSTKLILTQDLDPDYAFMRAIQEQKKMSKQDMIDWCILKLFVYDTASELSIMAKKKDFDTAHYGSERRKNKRNTKEQFADMYRFFNIQDLPREYNEAKKFLTSFNGVGDWAAWKFCDLMERVVDIPMDFSKVDFRTAYEYPLRGLCRVNNQPDSFVKTLADDEIYIECMINAEYQLNIDLKAPPKLDRQINIQEIETCLCKYHSYLNGHYEIGKDTLHLIKRFKEEGHTIPIDLLKLHSNPLQL